MLELKGCDIVGISTSAWDYPFGSKQQIMLRLSRYNRVLFVEPQLSILHGFKYPLLFLNKLKNSFRGLWHPTGFNKNLFVFSPPPFYLPFENYFLFVNCINQKILSFFLKFVFKKIGFKPTIFWAFHPRSVKLFGNLGEKITVYHCIDEYSSEKSNQSRKKALKKLENEITQKADVVFVCSKELLKLKNKLRADAVLLLPGVDLDNFEIAIKQNAPPDINIIKSPRIGFAGSLDRRLDVKLISEIAMQRPAWSIVLIGPNRLNSKSKQILEKFKNIFFLGPKSIKEIPVYLSALDICILPYFIDEFTKYIFPLKLFEYFAAGKPIISTALPDLINYSDFVAICRESDEFINTIENILVNGKKVFQNQLIIAKANSWDARIVELTGVLNKNLEKMNANIQA